MEAAIVTTSVQRSRLITTTEMILGGSAQTLMEVDTKPNCYLKCWAIKVSGHVFTPCKID
jgi:hypothetical protein